MEININDCGSDRSDSLFLISIYFSDHIPFGTFFGDYSGVSLGNMRCTGCLYGAGGCF